MAEPLFKKIGKAIAKSKGPADPIPDEEDDTATDGDGADDESSESPGEMLAEALGLNDADPVAIDAALKKAFEKFSK